ncbi:MAG: methyl-accepting chemotaxis protein [Oscillospiraceae bacterium]|nr:methyl-accepting chemotaxis protein [Oscillospiraceae bacterium]
MKWFTNMKIGAKFFLSFGIVILLVAVLAVTVFITNQSSSNYLSTIETMSVFQGDTVEFIESFGNASVEATSLYAGDDAAAYQGAGKHYNTAKEWLAALILQANDAPGLSKFTGEFERLAGELDEWMSLVEQLNTSNKSLLEMRGHFSEKGEAATRIAMEIYNAQLENLEADIADGKDDAAMLRRKGRVQHGADITMQIAAMEKSFTDLIAYDDLSAVPQSMEAAYAILASLDKYIDDSSQQKDKDIGEAVKAEITEYINLTDNFISEVDSKYRLMNTLKAKSEATTASAAAVNTEVSGAVAGELVKAKATGLTSQIVAISLALVALVFSVAIALVLTRNITKRLSSITAFMQKAGSTGDITLRPEDAADIERNRSKDEIGILTEGCAGFIKHITHIAEELETVAGGDLTIEIELLSGQDVMGKALVDMVNSLNRMFGEINQSTAQVSSGSKQIADGAQSLAQGSTEQASSIEQLSASITEIAQKTKDNADMAGKAAILANTIKQNAETGSQQMEEMIEAVRDINSASQSISKVIKTIDDIAFQTNILALNAAVEAARAGQHGKGFAVVAEEVRNLATKSADAAKETSSMIEDSMEKAELGSRIAGETAASLAEIVQGINESSQIVTEIAQSSDEQSAGIAQINTGIDQVASVVQQNSATAEQSAAASEEMSGQSATLEDLVAQFKLKDGTRGIRRPAQSAALPPVAGRQINMPSKTAYTPDGGEFGKY